MIYTVYIFLFFRGLKILSFFDELIFIILYISVLDIFSVCYKL